MRLDDAANFVKFVVSALFGTDLSDLEALIIAGVVVGASMFVTFGLITYRVVLWVRRRLGDDEAIADDQAAMVRLIKNDLQSMRRSIERFGETLGSTIGGQLDSLNNSLAAVTPDSGNENDDEPEEKRGVRLFYAERVRDAVMHKFMAGNWFTESRDERHVFFFRNISASNIPIFISVATPYRKIVQDDTVPDYTLEVRSAGKKLMLFEWDYEGAIGPKVTFLARDRKWVEDVAAWNFPEIELEPVRKVVAAE